MEDNDKKCDETDDDDKGFLPGFTTYQDYSKVVTPETGAWSRDSRPHIGCTIYAHAIP